MIDSDRAWRRWSETEPYYGVLAEERYRQESFTDHSEAFWATGPAYLTERMDAAERYFGAFARRRALDFGCGVGRLSLPMAQSFETVLGLDVAPAMLAQAQRKADEAGLANLRFALSDDALGAADGRFDLVMSCIVLQHIPLRRGMAILHRLLDLVELGGIAALQLCVDRRDTPAQAMRYWVQRHVPGAHALFNRARGLPASEPLMQMNAYSLDQVLPLAASLGFGHSFVEIALHGKFLGAQLLMRRQFLPAS